MAGCNIRQDFCVAVLRQISSSSGNPGFAFKTFVHRGGNLFI